MLERLMRDESGYVLSAEAVLIGTIAVVGATTGLKMVASSVNEELTDVAYALRSLDQSYEFAGTESCRAWTAGSHFKQMPVDEAIEQLCAEAEEGERRERLERLEERLEQLRREIPELDQPDE